MIVPPTRVIKISRYHQSVEFIINQCEQQGHSPSSHGDWLYSADLLFCCLNDEFVRQCSSAEWVPFDCHNECHYKDTFQLFLEILIISLFLQPFYCNILRVKVQLPWKIFNYENYNSFPRIKVNIMRIMARVEEVMMTKYRQARLELVMKCYKILLHQGPHPLSSTFTPWRK